MIEEACRLLGLPLPPLQTLEEAGLSPMAPAFYAENRRVANGKAKRRAGLAAALPDLSRRVARAAHSASRPLSATTSPTIASTAPPAASADQR